MPDTVDTVIGAPDDGWRYHSKHVEQFANINKLYIVASCWIIIDTSCWYVSFNSVCLREPQSLHSQFRNLGVGRTSRKGAFCQIYFCYAGM